MNPNLLEKEFLFLFIIFGIFSKSVVFCITPTWQNQLYMSVMYVDRNIILDLVESMS